MDQKNADLIKEWVYRTGTHIEQTVVKNVRYTSPFNVHHPLDEFRHSSVEHTEEPGFRMIVKEKDLEDLIKSNHRLLQLMRLPEVREAMFYYRMAGYIDFD